jgi:hypothetical protein
MNGGEVITPEGLLEMGLTRERVLDHWMEDLAPEQPDDGGPLAWMTGRDGSRAKWMPEGPDIRHKLRAKVDEIREAVARIQAGNVMSLYELIPKPSNAAAENQDWEYVGVTRVGDTLELWFTAEAWFHVPAGTLKLHHDMAIVRCPLTNATLRDVVVDRVEFLNREPFVVPPKE